MRDATPKETKYSVEEALTTRGVEPSRCGRQALTGPQGAAKGAAMSCVYARGRPGAAS